MFHSSRPDRAAHRDLLLQLYAAADWTRSPSYACRRGCSVCCTQSVTITSLEGELILATLDRLPVSHPAQNAVSRASSPLERPRLTTNQFAKACLEGVEVDEEPGWNLDPCPFLMDGECSIYAVRPFGCRALVAQEECGANGYAAMPAEALTLNTLFFQIIEHLDQGGMWGNLFDVLNAFSGRAPMRPLARCEPVPGWLLTPEEKQWVGGRLAGILTLCDDFILRHGLGSRLPRGLID